MRDIGEKLKFDGCRLLDASVGLRQFLFLLLYLLIGLEQLPVFPTNLFVDTNGIEHQNDQGNHQDQDDGNGGFQKVILRQQMGQAVLLTLDLLLVVE